MRLDCKTHCLLAIVDGSLHKQIQARRKDCEENYRRTWRRACDRFCQVSGGQILNFLEQLRIIPLTTTL